MGLFGWKGPILFGLSNAAVLGSPRARLLVGAKFREKGKIVRRALVLPLKASQIPFATRECDSAKAGVTNGGVPVLIGGSVHEGFSGFHSHSRHGKTSYGNFERSDACALILVGWQTEKFLHVF
jgi:hypothetical protein